MAVEPGLKAVRERRDMPLRLINKINFSALLIIFVSVISCVQVAQTKRFKDLSILSSTESVIVLFHIKPVIKGKDIYIGPYYTIFRVKIQSIQDGQVAKTIAPLSPNPPDEVLGWLYITIPPGGYSINLAVRGRGELMPSYTVNIPQGKPIVYIGSFKMQCGITSSASFSSLIPTYCISSCRSPVDMTDEASEALGISKTFFNQFGPPAISLAQRK